MLVIQKKYSMKGRGEAKFPQSPHLSLNCLKLKQNATHGKHNKSTEQIPKFIWDLNHTVEYS